MQKMEDTNERAFADRFMHVPSEVSAIYEQACRISEDSPRAAVALCRCCLEFLLGHMGYGGTLAHMIRQAVTETNPAKSLSTYLRNSLEIVRFLGNVATHPTYDGQPTQLIEVDEDEADWCVDIIERLLDEYYEWPEFAETRLMAYEGSLQALGRKKRPFV